MKRKINIIFSNKIETSIQVAKLVDDHLARDKIVDSISVIIDCIYKRIVE